MTRPGSIRQVAIIGCGRMGSAFAEALSSRGYQVLPISARRRASSRELAAALGLPTHQERIRTAGGTTPSPDLLLLTVPDDALEVVAGEAAQAGVVAPGAIVAHPSGSLTSECLASCRSRGALVASFHPLQTFPRGLGDGARFAGISIGFEGDQAAKAPLRELAMRLGADLFEVPRAHKIEYHTAAVVACSGLAALLDLAVELFAVTGSLPGESLRRLRPLIDATLENIEVLGASGALTGPVVRGDVRTVQRELETISEAAPRHEALFAALSGALVALAEQREDAPRAQLERIRKLLAEARGPVEP